MRLRYVNHPVYPIPTSSKTPGKIGSLSMALIAPTAVQSATIAATPMVATAYLSSTLSHCRVLRSLDDLRRLRRALAAGRRSDCDPFRSLGAALGDGHGHGHGASAGARQRGKPERRGEAAGGDHGRHVVAACGRGEVGA
uniref:Uncharacterized protein n=1 Tax=Arundo donax TaxID=35708 RepID=A0A0A9G592_ARUDO